MWQGFIWIDRKNQEQLPSQDVATALCTSFQNGHLSEKVPCAIVFLMSNRDQSGIPFHKDVFLTLAGRLAIFKEITRCQMDA